MSISIDSPSFSIFSHDICSQAKKDYADCIHSWLMLCKHYTEGHTFNTQENQRHQYNFEKMLPPQERGEKCAELLIQEFFDNNAQAKAQDTDAFFLIVLQFLASTNLSEEDTCACLKAVVLQLQSSSPLEHPLLQKIFEGINAGVTFPLIQSFLELIAIETFLREPKKISTDFLECSNEIHFQMNFNGYTLILPFQPEKALKTFENCYLLCNGNQEAKKAFEHLYKHCVHLLQQKNFPREHKLYSLAETVSHSFQEKYHNALRQTSSLAKAQIPLLSHFALLLIDKSDIDQVILDNQTLINSFIQAFCFLTWQNTDQEVPETFLLDQLPLEYHLINRLLKDLANILKSGKKAAPKQVRNAFCKALIKDPRLEAQLLACDLWKQTIQEKAFNKKEDQEEIETGDLLLTTFIQKKRWDLALEVLELCSQNKGYPIDQLFILHDRLRKALVNSSGRRRDQGVMKLTCQLKDWLQSQKHLWQQLDTDSRSAASAMIKEMVAYALENGEASLACDLYMLSIDSGLFLDKEGMIEFKGEKISEAMSGGEKGAPLFAGNRTENFEQVKGKVVQEEREHFIAFAEHLKSQTSQSKEAEDLLFKILKSFLSSIPSEQDENSHLERIVQLAAFLLDHADIKDHHQLSEILIEHHYKWIQELIDQEKPQVAKHFIEALNQHFDTREWDERISTLILENFPEHQDLCAIANRCMEGLTEQQVQDIRARLCNAALKACEENNHEKAIQCARQLTTLDCKIPLQKEELARIIDLIKQLQDTNTPFLIRDLAHFALQDPLDIDSAHTLIKLTAAALAKHNEWDILFKWVKYNEEKIDETCGAALASIGLKAWNRRKKINHTEEMISLVQRYPGIPFSDLAGFMQKMQSSKKSNQQKEAIKIWLQATCGREDCAPSLLIAGWKAALGFNPQAFTPESVKEVLKFSIDSQDDELQAIAYETLLLRCDQSKRRAPCKEVVCQILKLYEQLPEPLQKNHRKILFKTLKRVKMPVNALAIGVQIEEKSFDEDATQTLFLIAKQLHTPPRTLVEEAVKNLCSMVKAVPITQKNFNNILNLLQALINIENNQIYESACNLLKRHLSQFLTEKFHREKNLKIKKTIAEFDEKQKTVANVLAFGGILDYLFTTQRFKNNVEYDAHIRSLLNLCFSEKNLCEEDKRKALERFFYYAEKGIRQDPRFQENLGKAVGLNLSLYRQNEDIEEFTQNNNLLWPSLLLTIRTKTQRSRIPVYEKSDVENWEVCLSAQKFLSHILNSNHKQALQAFTPVFDELLQFHFNPSSEENENRKYLRLMNRNFVEFCQEESKVDGNSLDRQFKMLNQANAAYLSHPSLKPLCTQSVLQWAFDSLLVYVESIESDVEEIQKFFDSLMFAPIPQKTHEFKKNLSKCYETLTKLHGTLKKTAEGNDVEKRNREIFYIKSFLYIFLKFPENRISETLNQPACIEKTIKKFFSYHNTASFIRIPILLNRVIANNPQKDWLPCLRCASELMRSMAFNEHLPSSIESIAAHYPIILANLPLFLREAFFDLVFNGFMELIDQAGKKSSEPPFELNFLFDLPIKWLTQGMMIEPIFSKKEKFDQYDQKLDILNQKHKEYYGDIIKKLKNNLKVKKS